MQHLHAGEDKKFTSESATKASRGAPYSGFFRLDHCAYVTLKDCGFTDHLNVSDGTYDFYAEYAAAITIDHCVCLPDTADDSSIRDPRTWGTTGTNYCKNLSVINHSKLSRVDGHMGVYNITVKDSTLGDKSVAAVGFGTMYLENVKSYGEHLVNLRKDYGSAWFGDVVIKDCTWVIDRYDRTVFDITYDPTVEYGYDEIIKGGRRYASQLPNNITIDGLTVDASKVPDNNYGFYTRGLNLFNNVIVLHKTINYDMNDEYLNHPAHSYEEFTQQQYNYEHHLDSQSAVAKYGYLYFFPLKVPETINVHKIHIIRKNAQYHSNNKISGIFMRNRNPAVGMNDYYFFDKEYDKPYFNVEAVDANGKPLFDYSKEVTYETAD